MKILFLLLLLITFTFIGLSQNTNSFKLSGIIKDATTGEVLFSANIYAKSLQRGVISDENGKYSISLPTGQHNITFSFIGYSPITKTINIDKDIKLNILLTPIEFTGEVAEVKSSRIDQNVKSAEVGTVFIPIERLKTLPALLGEVDILKSVQLLPGIQAGGEGSNSYYVRGGGADQNLVSIDGATVYNPSHLMGFFSVFNADAIDDAQIIKGGMAPEYGGRMSSVLDIKAREGNKDQYMGELGVGLLSAKALVEGPIQKGRSSFIISGRRTYADLLMGLFSKGTQFDGLGYYFYDLNAKLTFQLSSKDNLSLTGYYGRDKFGMNQPDIGFNNDISWANGLATAKWNHFFNSKMYLTTSFVFTDYQFSIGMQESVFNLNLYSGIRDIGGNSTFVWDINKRNKVKFGFDYKYHTFTPSTVGAESDGTQLDFGSINKLYANDLAIFAQQEVDLGERWKLLYGLRYSFFALTGPYTQYTIDNVNDMNNIDSTMYKPGEIVKPYHRFEPRLNVRFEIDKTKSLKFSASQNYQFISLAAMSSVSLPADVWFPTTSLVKPQGSTQVSLGYFQNFLNNSIEASIEVYYKYMTNLIEYRPGVDITNSMNTNMDYCFTFGNGDSYGVELFINKTIGNLTGWVGYTLSWSNRTFPEINDGKVFPAKYDRRNDVSLMLSYRYKKWDFSTVWVFASGNASTLPASLYIIGGNVITEWGEYNSWRMPNYHRMDISATWHLISGKHVEGSLNFSVYNVYNRANPYFISYKADGNLAEGKLKITPYQVSIFPILPSIGINLKFK